MASVAAAAGVSQMTVSRFFNAPEKLSPATFKRIQKVVEEVNYIPNSLTRNIVHGISRTVTLLVGDISNPFSATIVRGVEEALRQRGYLLFLGNTFASKMREREYLELMISHKVAGVILEASASVKASLELLSDHGVSAVFIDRQVAGGADTVRGDSYRAGRTLTQHLIAQGYKNIVFLGGTPTLYSLKDRLRGYKEVMREHDLEPRSLLGSYQQSSGEALMHHLFEGSKTLPEVIVAANNAVALGCFRVLQHAGLSVPDDVALAAFDDIESNTFREPFLTVVAQPAREIGLCAVEHLVDRLNGYDGPPRHTVLPVELKVRQSTPSKRGELQKLQSRPR